MPVDRRRELRFTKYEQILNIIFGAAFGALGSISLEDNRLSASWFLLVIYVVGITIPSIWTVASVTPIARCIAEGNKVRGIMYVGTLIGLALSCVVILVLSEVLSDWGIAGRGTELSAILAAWALTYLIAGLWVRIQDRLA
jgi:hypothetical protein